MRRILASLAAMGFVAGRAGVAEAAGGPQGLAVLEAVLEQWQAGGESPPAVAEPTGAADGVAE